MEREITVVLLLKYISNRNQYFIVLQTLITDRQLQLLLFYFVYKKHY